MEIQSKLYGIVYISSAKQKYSDDELQMLFEQSLVHNKINGISGVLVYADGNVLQLLEGDEQIVKDVYYNKIAIDNRHNGQIILFEGELTERCFANWRMVFKPNDPTLFNPFSAFTSPTQFTALLNENQKDSEAITLLKSFYNTNILRNYTSA